MARSAKDSVNFRPRAQLPFGVRFSRSLAMVHPFQIAHFSTGPRPFILSLLALWAVAFGAMRCSAQVEDGVMDPQMQAVLDEFASLQPRRVETLSVADARKEPTIDDAVRRVIARERSRAAVTADPGAERCFLHLGEGRTLEARIYHPKGTGPFPVILYLPDGGWVLSGLQQGDSVAQGLCQAAHAIVIAADCRHAPEFKFPAAHEDAVAAYRWTVEHAAELRGDPNRVALVGEGSGANMAGAICEVAGARRLPMPHHLVLICPLASCECHTRSCLENSRAQPLSAPMKLWFLTHYLNSPVDQLDPRISLLDAPHLGDFPPTTVLTAEFDPLRSEGQQLAAALRRAGAFVTERNFRGVTHGFVGMGAVVEQAYEAMAFVGGDLRDSFAQAASR